MSHHLTIGVLALQGAFAEHSAIMQRLSHSMKEEDGSIISVREIRTAEEMGGKDPLSTSDQLRSNVIGVDGGNQTSTVPIDGLIIPGGESTAITRLLQEDNTGLVEALRSFIADGRPVFGTCAGAILLANRIVTNPSPSTPILGGMRVSMARNWYGRQLASFTKEVQLEDAELQKSTSASGLPPTAIFIRAPAFVEVEKGVQVLATLPSQESHVRAELPPVQGEASANAHPAVKSHAVAVRDGNLLATCFHPELSADTRWHRYFIDMCQQSKNARVAAATSAVPSAAATL